MKKFLMVCLALIFMCGCVESNEDYKAALSLFEENKYTDAVEKFNLCGDYKDTIKYLDKCYKEIGSTYLSNDEFDEAIEQYKLISDEEYANELVEDALYKKGVFLKDSNKYTEAYYTFEAIKDYKDSSSLMEDLMFLKKYEFFDFEGTNEKYKDFYNMTLLEGDTYSTAEDVENKRMQGYYHTWNDHNDNSTYVIDKYYIDGRAYHVLACNGIHTLISYDDEPDVFYSLYKYQDYCYGELIDILNMETNEIVGFSSVTYDEWLEEKAKKPSYTDKQIVDKTVNVMKSKIGSFYDPVDRIYHNCVIDSSSVTYDSSTLTYTCYVTITYSTNVFDFWGTSNTIYNCVATYKDTGNDLATLSFQMN